MSDRDGEMGEEAEQALGGEELRMAVAAFLEPLYGSIGNLEITLGGERRRAGRHAGRHHRPLHLHQAGVTGMSGERGSSESGSGSLLAQRQTPQENPTGAWAPLLVVASVVPLVAAARFAYKGWKVLYDDSYRARVVGGDAYNYIIYAGRGTAYVCIGIVCALAAVNFAIFAVLDRLPRPR